MYFKQTIDISASSAAATTYVGERVVGHLHKIRMVRGTLSTKNPITFGIKGESSSLNFLSIGLKTTGQNYYPRYKAHTPTAGTSFILSEPVALVNEQVKMWVVATTSKNKRTATISLYFDGVPGAGGSTS
jgi:hypothetical protein